MKLSVLEFSASRIISTSIMYKTVGYQYITRYGLSYERCHNLVLFFTLNLSHKSSLLGTKPAVILGTLGLVAQYAIINQITYPRLQYLL